MMCLKKNKLVALLLFVSFFIASKGLADSPFVLDDYAKSIIQKAKEIKLAESRPWRKVLFISDSHFFPSRSLVDDKYFYFSERGHKDPAAELEASLVAFFKPDIVKIDRNFENHPRCIFAARWHFLKKNLGIDEKKIVPVQCPNVEKYRRLAEYTGLSLVFSSYFINSPASMFGHTFLRLHREQGGQNENGLLDDAASFAASVRVYNPLTYPFQGLFGAFRGQFSMLPYFQKIQEYNNYESRDLWEYRLNFTQEELDFLTLVLFEMGHFKIDYYYLDDNCSFILNLTLEAAKPELVLTNDMHLYAIPVDTMKSVTRNPGLIKSIDFRPSAFSRYKHRVLDLPKSQQDIVTEVIADDSLTPLEKAKGCDDKCQVHVLDTVVEYIDFKEKLSGLREAETYGPLRRASLSKRSKLKIPSKPMDPYPKKEIPDSGHWSSAVGLKSGWTSADASATFFQWKPALQDLDGHTQAYGNQMQLSFLNTEFAYIENLNQVYMERIRALELFAMPKGLPGHKPWGWYLNLGADVLRTGFRDSDRFTRYTFEIGSGLSWYFAKDRGQFYIYLHGMGGFSPHRRGQWFLSPVVHGGFRFRFTDSFQVHLKTRYDYVFGRENWEFWRSRLRFTYYPSVNHEIFLEGNYRTSTGMGLAGFRIYY